MRRSLLDTDDDYRAAMTHLVLRLGLTADEIHRRHAGEWTYSGARPGLRAVQKHAEQIRAGKGEPWELSHATAEQGARILRVLAAVAERGDTHLPGELAAVAKRTVGVTFTVELAETIDMVVTAAPDIPGWWAYWLALKYLARWAQRRSTDGFDLLLAFHPWRGDGEFERFATLALRLGWLTLPANKRPGRIHGALMDALRMQSERCPEVSVGDLMTRLVGQLEKRVVDEVLQRGTSPARPC